MLGILAMTIAYVTVKKLDNLTSYRQPKGKYKNRYK